MRFDKIFESMTKAAGTTYLVSGSEQLFKGLPEADSLNVPLDVELPMGSLITNQRSGKSYFVTDSHCNTQWRSLQLTEATHSLEFNGLNIPMHLDSVQDMEEDQRFTRVGLSSPQCYVVAINEATTLAVGDFVTLDKLELRVLRRDPCNNGMSRVELVGP